MQGRARIAALLFRDRSCYSVNIYSWTNPTVLCSLSLDKVVAYILSKTSVGDHWLTDHKLKSYDASGDDRLLKFVVQALDLLLLV